MLKLKVLCSDGQWMIVNAKSLEYVQKVFPGKRVELREDIQSNIQ